MGAKINYGFLKTKRIMDKKDWKIYSVCLIVLKCYSITVVYFKL